MRCTTAKTLRDVVGIELSRESVPDATTLLKFHHRLLESNVTGSLFEDSHGSALP